MGKVMVRLCQANDGDQHLLTQSFAGRTPYPGPSSVASVSGCALGGTLWTLSRETPPELVLKSPLSELWRLEYRAIDLSEGLR